MATATKPVSLDALDPEFLVKRVKIRGHRYVVTELSMKSYQKTVKQATTTDEEDGSEKFDPETHNRILIGATVIEDGEKADTDDIYRRGTRLVRALLDIIRDLHFGEEKVEDDEDDGEGEATPTVAKPSASAT